MNSFDTNAHTQFLIRFNECAKYKKGVEDEDSLIPKAFF